MGIQKMGTKSDLVQWQKDLGTVLQDEMGLDPDQKHSVKVIQEANLLLCRRYLEGQV